MHHRKWLTRYANGTTEELPIFLITVRAAMHAVNIIIYDIIFTTTSPPRIYTGPHRDSRLSTLSTLDTLDLDSDITRGTYVAPPRASTIWREKILRYDDAEKLIEKR